MKVCLIDADSKIPNIPLMKLSTYHKQRGDEVELFKAKLPYFPSRKKKDFYAPEGFDKHYCSTVFTGNVGHIHGDNIEFGGTGFSLNKDLSEEVNKCEKDYSIYPNGRYALGFLTRGCIRNCSFCFVPKKEGVIRLDESIDEIINPNFKQVMFLDNNFLAHADHKHIMRELISRKISCRFNQGLDIRLIDEENSDLLRRLHTWNRSIFAFDDWSYLPLIEKKWPLLSWGHADTKGTQQSVFVFFAYVNADMEISNIVNRLNWLYEHKVFPYVMRDINCWGSENEDFYADLCGWCNAYRMYCFPGQNFREYLEMYGTSTKRILRSEFLYYGKNEIDVSIADWRRRCPA